MDNKKIILAAVFVIISAVAVVILVMTTEPKPITTTYEEGAPAISQFSPEQQDKIREASANWQESEGRDTEKINEFFEEVPEEDIYLLINLCKEGSVNEPITCLRLLAIEKPDFKEEICDAIDEEACGYYGDESQCMENLEDIKIECKLLLPFLR